jgi:N-acetylmuramoyl-L-alanine amidase
MSLSSKIKVLITVILVAISLPGFSQNKKFKVTLDAGHGGHDFGAVYSGYVEKNIALAVVLKVGKILEEQPGMEVNYTRKTDVFIELNERANIANRIDANIFVSIHCNANKNRLADGTETYVMGMTKNASSLAVAKSENEVVTLEKDYKQKYEGFDPNSPETLIGLTLMQEDFLNNSISLASKIEDGFADLGKKIRGGGVKQAGFLVLHKAYMPRVLIEMGFISNSVEGAILNSEEGQNDMAKAIANAIVSYKSEYFGNGTNETTIVRPSQKLNESTKTESIVPKNTKSEKKESLNPSSSIIFKVQIGASNKKLELVPSNFKGLKSISMIEGKRIYKYMYQETVDYTEAKQFLKEAKSKGYKSAFLVAVKDGNIVPLEDVIK